MACDRIKVAITAAIVGDRPIKAILDAYNLIGSSTRQQGEIGEEV